MYAGSLLGILLPARRWRNRCHDKVHTSSNFPPRSARSWRRWSADIHHRIATLFGPRSSSWPPKVWRIGRSPGASTIPSRSSPSGASASSSNVWPDSTTWIEPGGTRVSPPEVVVAVKSIACELPARPAVLPAAHPRHPGGGHQAWPGGRDLGDHDLALAGRRRHQALDPPQLDLPPRPRLRGQSRTGSRPLWTPVRRPEAEAKRVRDLGRREDLDPSPHPLPSLGRRQLPPPDAGGA